MLPVYAILEQARARGRVDFTDVTVFMLDEYVGLAADHSSSFTSYAKTRISGPLGIPDDHLHLPAGSSEQRDVAAAAYDKAISDAGGIALQVVGIGSNGHIGFNEPSSPLQGRTRVTELADSTRTDNAGDFAGGEAVPTLSITMGIGTILSADEIVALATGATKAAAVEAAICGPVSDALPASALQLHPNVTFVLDSAAASDAVVRRVREQERAST